MTPNDPLFSSQWFYSLIGDIQTVWNEFDGSGVHVGIYDTGVDYTHPDLAANYDSALQVTVDGTTYGGGPDDASSYDQSHGTAVAGLIAAVGNNGVGVIGGAFGASITGVDVFDTTTPIYINAKDFSPFIDAVLQMANFDVTNNSWGASPGFYEDQSVDSAGSFAQATVDAYGTVSADGRGGLGTVIVQAAGNDNLDANGDGLNASRFTVTVAAALQSGFAASYSNYGASILLTAPGSSVPGSIVTTDRSGSPGYSSGDYTTSFNGTSAATPIVTSVVALMLQANPELGWRDVQTILAASSTHTGSAYGAGPGTNESFAWQFNGADNWNGGGMHFSEDYGYGMLNAYNAVRMAEAWQYIYPAAQTSANEQSVGTGTLTANVALPDLATTTYSFTVSGDLSIEHVDLTLNLTHSYFNDLRIYLISPDGTEVQLYDGRSGDSSTADAGLTWTFGIDDLRGELAAGTWTVSITDAVHYDSGTLNTVQLVAYGSTPSVDDVYHYTDEFAGLLALDPTRGTLADTNGGTDWIDASAMTGDLVIDLNAGAGSTSNGSALFSIAPGTTIENAITGDGNDVLTGNDAANVLMGMRGNDRLDGGGGADTMRGGAGNDIYVVDNPGDVVDESVAGGGGTDEVRSSITFSLADGAHAKGTIENLTLTGNAAIDGTGNAVANVITGNGASNVLDGAGGDDTLDGGGGADIMRGGAGNDIYVVDNPGDVADESVSGSGGTDVVQSSITFSLADGVHAKGTIENLTLTGTADINGTGNGVANVITGNGGDNTLDGGLGADTMRGGGGNDIYIVDNSGDVVDESVAGSGGTDEVRSSVSFSLKVSAHAKGAIENLTLTGTADINATGNGHANTLIGNSGDNNIDGRKGNDDLYGGAGSDNFIFDTKISNQWKNVDVVHDFSIADDTIVLDNAIFPKLGSEGYIKSKFFYEGPKAHDKNDYLIFNDKNDELIYDSNGSKHGHAVVIAIIDGNWHDSFSYSDFLIV